jgi:hypothetical protein
MPWSSCEWKYLPVILNGVKDLISAFSTECRIPDPRFFAGSE